MDKEDLYRVMYGQKDEDDEAPDEYRERYLPRPLVSENRVARHRRTTLIKLGEQTFEVPNLRYVNDLEREIDELKRKLGRLDTQLRQTKALLTRQGSDLKDVWHELDRKLDSR